MPKLTMKDILTDTQLPPAARIVYISLIKLAKKHGKGSTVMLTYFNVASYANLSYESVRLNVIKLEGLGYVEIYKASQNTPTVFTLLK